MLYIIAVVAGLLSGLALKGSAKNLLKLDMTHKWTFITAFIVQFAFQLVNVAGLLNIADYSFYVQAVVFIFLLTGFWLNRRWLGSLITGMGCALNAAAMLFNNGKMPVTGEIVNTVISDTELRRALLSDGKHALAGRSTKMLLLIDNTHIPGFFGIGMRIVSIGDLVVVAGIFFLVFELTINRELGIKSVKARK